jgi:RNA polymerase sigma-70 factor (ECF subfamily)
MGCEREHTDAVLVGRAQAGDGEAFAELFRRHYPVVLRACSRRLPGDAEELAQAAFVRAFERIDQCTGEQRFGGWVQVIARHLCTDALRARARADAYARDAAEGPPGAAADWPEEHALRREQIEVLTGVLLGLPRRQREVLVAREIEGRRPTEIAAALGVSLGTVDSLLLRARRAVAAGYRTMAAEQGTASVASTAVAAMAAGGAAAAAGPPTVWRAVRRGAEAVWGAAVRLGVAAAGSAGPQLVAGTVVVVALAGPPPGTPPPAAVPAGRAPAAPVTLPSPGVTPPSVPEPIAVPAPATPRPPVTPVAPNPPAPLAAPGAPAPPVRTPAPPNSLGSIFTLLDVEAAFDGGRLPQVAEAPDLEATAREVWQAGRAALTEAGTSAWRTAEEIVQGSRSEQSSAPM